MQNEQHLSADQSQETRNWYGELCEIMASEQMFRLPNCEWLLDRLIANSDRPL